MTTPIYLFANNAQTTLAAPLAPSDVSMTVQTGDGAKFPNPGLDQAFTATLVSANNPTVNEIVLVTARGGDVCTITRAQEGTTALSWSILDFVNNYPTAGTMENFVQQQQLQYVATRGGTANAITGLLASQLVALYDGMQITFTAGGANTSTVTFDLTLGSTDTGAISVVKNSNNALVAGDIPSAGYPVQLNYSVAYNAWVMQNPAPPLFLWIPASAFLPTTGTPTQSVTTEALPQVMWTFPHGSLNAVSTSFMLPPDYSASAGVNVELYWISQTNSAGNVRIGVSVAATPFNGVQGTVSTANGTLATVGTANEMQASSFINSTINAYAVGASIGLKVSRDGTSGSDTYTSNFQFIGAQIKFTG